MWSKKGNEKTVRDVFLRNIGENSLEDINDWFRKSYADGYRIDHLDEAVELAEQFRNRHVTIVGDYDADGCTATSILMLALKWAGFKYVRFRIPKRFSEGFGINPVIIDEIHDGLVITCDNGVAQIEAMTKAHNKGLKIIILDHHKASVNEDGKDVLPPADVIIDPSAIQGSADFDSYCGAGLAFRFARRLLRNQDARKIGCLQALAAIGTVADVMPLREENYVIVRNGLKKLVRSDIVTSGMYSIVEANNVTSGVTAADIGFKVAPCINASSRMKDDGAKDAVELLTFDGDLFTAERMAAVMIERNNLRKQAKVKGLKDAEQKIVDECLFGNCPLMIYLPGVGEGIIGILAGNLAEKYGVPAIIMTDSENPEELKGSARSAGDYDMKQSLDHAADLLVKYGGHKGAAGLTVSKDRLVDFYNRMQQVSSDFVPVNSDDHSYDLEITEKDVPKVCEEVQKYAPFGEGNPAPVFKITGFVTMPVMGKYSKEMGDGSIVKLQSNHCSAIGYNHAGDCMKPMKMPKKVTLYGTISYNNFGGASEPQIEYAECDIEEHQERTSSLAAKLRARAVAAST